MMELKQVSAGYGKQMVVKTVSCAFDNQEFVCLIGRNGSGKSTLLRAMAGIAPFSGTILLDNRSITAMSGRERAGCISYLPQTRPVPAMTVGMMVEHGRFPYLGFSKVLKTQDREMVGRAAEAAGIIHLMERELHSLSGGERQRVYIAMSIAQDAGMILLDEPTTFLDVEYQLEILALLKRLNRQGRGIVMVVHDLVQAFSYADRILVMDDGVIKAGGKPEELADNRLIGDIFGVDITRTEEENRVYPYQLVKREG